MTFLNKLPTVETCFGCIRLKIGCYIVVFASLFFATMVPSIAAEVYRCYDLKKTTIKFVIFASSAMFVYSIGISIYFLYGLCTERSNHPTMVYLFMLLKAMILTVIVAILVFIESPLKRVCPDGFVLGTSTTLNLFIQGYSLLIVNSYRLEENFDDNDMV